MSEEMIIKTEYSDIMQKSYIDYAMSVIVARALPDVRDGLKPVQRRTLYDMHELGIRSDRPYRKCARIVGDTMGKYHPHGDSTIYEALVVMSQDFKKGLPLIDGHGNFGSIEGDGAAAMRYTEARLQKVSEEALLADLDKDIVDYFISTNQIYQDKQFKNVVFVGYDGDKPSYAFKRSIFKNYKLDHAGSNKSFSFSFTNPNSSILHVFEAAIDMLSYMTILKLDHQDFKQYNYLSLAGASDKIVSKTEADIPIALKSFLERNKNIKTIIFHLDNDEVGIGATSKIIKVLDNKYQCIDDHPKESKDVNEELVNIRI